MPVSGLRFPRWHQVLCGYACDQAGTLVGHAGLGMESPAADDPPIANAGWAAQVTLTRNMTGPHTLFFYAMSGVTGEEVVVAVPVLVAS